MPQVAKISFLEEKTTGSDLHIWQKSID